MNFPRIRWAAQNSSSYQFLIENFSHSLYYSTSKLTKHRMKRVDLKIHFPSALHSPLPQLQLQPRDSRRPRLQQRLAFSQWDRQPCWVPWKTGSKWLWRRYRARTGTKMGLRRRRRCSSSNRLDGWNNRLITKSTQALTISKQLAASDLATPSVKQAVKSPGFDTSNDSSGEVHKEDGESSQQASFKLMHCF